MTIINQYRTPDHTAQVTVLKGGIELVIVLLLISIILIFIIAFQYRISLNTRYILNRTNEINRRMMIITEELSNFRDINVLYKKLLSETINLIEGAESGSILIYDREKGYMDYKAAIGHNEEALKNVHFKKEELFLYDTTKLKAPDIIKDPLKFNEVKLDKHNFDDMMKSNSLSLKVCLSAPLYVSNEFYGIITVDNKTTADAFDKNDIKLISYICRELEIAIKNVILMNELGEALRTDKLTGLYNRRYFEEIVENLLKQKEIHNKGLCVIMIDLDNFKSINDTYGHREGDKVLKFFAEILSKSVRNNDLAVRYAGDEFVLLLFDSGGTCAEQVIDRIRNSIVNYPNNKIKLSFSAGVCKYGPGIDFDKLLTIADNNMYLEKRKHREAFL